MQLVLRTEPVLSHNDFLLSAFLPDFNLKVASERAINFDGQHQQGIESAEPATVCHGVQSSIRVEKWQGATWIVCLISCFRSWGMSERCAMSRMRVKGVLAVNSALKDGSLRPIPPFNKVEPSPMVLMQYLSAVVGILHPKRQPATNQISRLKAFPL